MEKSHTPWELGTRSKQNLLWSFWEWWEIIFNTYCYVICYSVICVWFMMPWHPQKKLNCKWLFKSYLKYLWLIHFTCYTATEIIPLIYYQSLQIDTGLWGMGYNAWRFTNMTLTIQVTSDFAVLWDSYIYDMCIDDNFYFMFVSYHDWFSDKLYRDIIFQWKVGDDRKRKQSVMIGHNCKIIYIHRELDRDWKNNKMVHRETAYMSCTDI